MLVEQIVFFTPYPFAVGQKIRITAGPRRGDWEVVDLSEQKVTLRCPVSQRQFTWDRFCYLSETRENQQWPQN